MRSPGPLKSETDNLLPKDGVLTYRPELFAPDEAYFLLEKLKDSIEWSRPSFKMYGKEFPIPRLAA